MDFVIDLINRLTMLLPFLLAFGAGWKYLPKVRELANEVIIPLLNSLITFFVALGGGATVAHAGIFGDAAKVLGPVASAVLAVGWASLAGVIHDKLVKPWTPPSPYTLKQAAKVA